ncbi:adenosylcobinamide-GDP ribazoletransferase, partial [Providencia rettgeri]
IFSARTRDRMLEIMRDSRLGTHGGLALIFVLVAKVLVVGELLLRDVNPIAALAAACAVGRGMAVLLMYRHRYAREKGLGNLFIGKISLQQTLVTMALAIALATALLGLQGLRAALIALVMLPFAPQPTLASAPYLLASCALQVVYTVLVAKTYQVSDMSQTYPLMRGTAPLLVAAISVLFLGDRLSPLAWLGI